ncbi:hypothetical protein LSH36_634g01047 [Paralvinella palmiformis]|uniref:Tetraspanin n=1 Tax=Paralvinella palmiformis TaxID=53620 RepID=A0AAD9J482_9ANNE|nr:hypothetical protein LSH36_634g01047 [Paralvinella palmiformis]
MPDSGLGAVKIAGKDDGCCGIFFLKYCLYIFNLIFWLSGGGVLAVGLWTLLTKHSYSTLLGSGVYPATTYILIATGALIIMVGFLGCCGAWRESIGCLMTYAAFLLLVFLLEAVVGILAYMYKSSIETELRRDLNHTMLHNYYMDYDMTLAIDDMQQSFRCCGAGSYEDWRYSRWLLGNPNINNTTPDSCCKTMSPHCAVRDHPSNIYYKGCMDVLMMFLQDHLIILGSVGLGLCCLQLFGIVFACVLASKIKDWKRRQKANLWG